MEKEDTAEITITKEDKEVKKDLREGKFAEPFESLGTSVGSN